MDRHHATTRLWWAALAVLVLAAVAPPAGADSWHSPLIIPAAEFENNGVFPLEDNFQDSYGYYLGRGTNVLFMMAPVILPQGVEVFRFEAAVLDFSEALCNEDVEVELKSINLSTGAVTTHASAVVTTDVGAVQIISDSTITDPFIDNLNHAYYVVAYSCTFLQGLQGVRIHYVD